jgi:hypothetical protein
VAAEAPVDSANGVINNSGRPTGTSVKAALRRLRDPQKGRPDIHARVLAGELSAHAGMIEAGFRKGPWPSARAIGLK